MVTALLVPPPPEVDLALSRAELAALWGYSPEREESARALWRWKRRKLDRAELLHTAGIILAMDVAERRRGLPI